MASPVGRSPVRRPPPPVAPAPGGTLRAQPVARPAVPAAVRIGALSAEQVIAEIERHGEATGMAAYEQGLRFLELSKPKRYRDELGYRTFEELLVARDLPSRMTAYKLIEVVSTFSQPEVKQLGGVARTYALVRFVKRQNENADPRKLLAPNARVLGRALADVKTSEIEKAMRGVDTSEE